MEPSCKQDIHSESGSRDEHAAHTDIHTYIPREHAGNAPTNMELAQAMVESRFGALKAFACDAAPD